MDALSNISLQITAGKMLGIIGSSGSGKSTLLQIIRRNLNPMKGHIEGVNAEDVLAFEQINPGPGSSLWSVINEDNEELARKIVEFLDIEDQIHKPFNQLSTGQGQRAKLCMALLKNPKIIVLDEVLSNLDRELKHEFMGVLRQSLVQFKIGAVIVGHDLESLFFHCHQIGLLHLGILHQIGTPQEILDTPRSYEVAKFIGYQNFITVNEVKEKAGKNIGIINNELSLELPCSSLSLDKAHLICLPPASLKITKEGAYKGKVINWERWGLIWRVVILHAGRTELKIPSFTRVEGSSLKFEIDEKEIIVLGEL